MKRINLEISNKLVAVTGNENGRHICLEQIIPAFEEKDLPITIVFPKYITTVGSSYIEGIVDALLQSSIITIDQYRSCVAIESADESVCKGVDYDK